MELTFAVICLAAVIAALYFAFEGAQLRQVANRMEGRNADLRHRIIELTTEIQRLREASGLPHAEFSDQKSEDELMPIRRVHRGGTRIHAHHPAGSWTTVLFVGSDANVLSQLTSILSSGGYQLAQTVSAMDAQKVAHELPTAALLFDLRDSTIAAIAQTVAAALEKDSLAKEVPLFALVATPKERTRLQDEGNYSAVFTAPVDTALLTSALGAALIRRKTRSRRAEAGRRFLTYFARS